MRVIPLRRIAEQAGMSVEEVILVIQTLINKGVVHGQLRQIAGEMVLLTVRVYLSDALQGPSGVGRTEYRRSREEPCMDVGTASVITCPVCGHVRAEQMATTSCHFFYECRGCGVTLRPEPGDCCVFCSYGTVPCPPVQRERANAGKRST